MWRRIAILLLLIIACGAPARAWDETGHKVVAYIAWQHMSDEARASVSEYLSHATPSSGLLGLRPSGANAGMIHFIRASAWPDVVRDGDEAARHERYHRGTWHYVNIFWERTADGAVRVREDLQPDEDNIVERLFTLERMARLDLVPSAQQALFISWIEHLVGDIHQPLHTSARVTRMEPDGDLGGNLFDLAESDNLHAYWDRALSDAFEREVGESELAYVRRVASSITRQAGPPASIELEFGGWAQRSFEIASRDLYDQVVRGEEPPVSYAEMTHATASEAVALAGYRLAAMMNSIYG